MFTKCITETPFNNEISNSVFQKNVYGDANGSDNSFVSTLRALLPQRMKFGDELRFYIKRFRYDANLEYIVTQYYISDGSINLFMASGRSEEAEEFFKKVDEDFAKNPMGLESIPKITEFFRKAFNIRCFVNKKTQTVYLITENLDLQRYHYLQCSTLAFLPWYFDKSEKVTEDEMALIRSLSAKDSDAYLAALAKIAEQYDMREVFIKNSLNGFELEVDKRQIKNYENSLYKTTKDIERYLTDIKDLIATKREKESLVNALKLKLKTQECENEIMNYFLRNKKLELVSRSDSKIKFVVKDSLSMYDEDYMESLINNKHSWIYEAQCDDVDYGSLIAPEDMGLLMKAIFIDRILKIRVCASFAFDISGCAECMSNIDYSRYPGYMPNPHIQYYGCMGDYSYIISDLASSGNYIAVIENCIASTQCFNLNDDTVAEAFMEVMYRGVYEYKSSYYTTNKCIELPDGTITDPTGAIAYLKGENYDG